MQDILIKAKTYKEFAEKVKEDAKKRNMLSLAFAKAVADVVMFTSKDGERFYYKWEKANEQDIFDE